jgi:hypothetical protein
MFTIEWSTCEAEWEKARRESLEHECGSQYDIECSAHYYLLYSTLTVRYDSASLFDRNQTDSITVSILDIGYQLARAIVDIKLTGRGNISASDDDIEASFTLEEGVILVTTNKFAPELRVPADEFLTGCQNFLSDVAESLRDRVPQLLDWQSIAPITAYLIR